MLGKKIKKQNVEYWIVELGVSKAVFYFSEVGGIFLELNN